MNSSRIFFALGLVAVGACTAAVNGGPSTVVPGSEPTPRLPRPTAAGGTNVASSTMRYVCRGKVSSGWIAIDYIDDSEACSTSRVKNGVAVIVPLMNTAVGGLLEVCADERIPAGWHEVQVVLGDPRCPPLKPTDTIGKATIRQILRDR